MTISFVSHKNTLRIKNKSRLKAWLQKVAKGEKKAIGFLTYIFTTDDFLFELNKKYLHHDTLTDIITFDYSEDGKLAGDVFISVERVRDNSKKYDCSFDEELNRVMVHGLLHLSGYKDKTKAARAVMRKKENGALSRLKKLK